MQQINKKNYIKYSMARKFFGLLKLNRLKRKWRKENSNNYTEINRFTNISNIYVKKGSYGKLNVISYNDKHCLKIGSYVSIADNVTFLLDVEHHLDHISTYPFKTKILETMSSEAFGKGDIYVGDDCWIGYGATIMSGVNIGKGAVIGCGAVVTHDIPPYAIVGGIPAKIIKFRFKRDIIDELIKIDISEWDYKFISDNIENLYSSITDAEDLEWISKK